METFYLQIEVQKEQTELLEGQAEGMTIEFDTEQEIRDSAESLCKWMYHNKSVKAYMIINRHSAEGNEPCDKILIYEQ